MKEKYKITNMLVTDKDIENIDNNWQSIIDKYLKMYVREKDQVIAQYLMRKQDKEIERLNNIIKEVREFVESMEYCGQEDYFYDLKANDECGNDNTFNDSKYKLLEILDKGE